MAGRVFADTNVFVYLYDRNAPDKQRIARDLVEREHRDLAVSPQVLQEFYVTVTRKLSTPLSEADAETAVRHLATFEIVPIDGAFVVHAIARSRRDKIAFWDALIVEAALAAKCARLYSEDLQDGRRFGSMVVVNPFVPGRF
jgi:predicted nucleic acid-binding protein